MSAASGQSGLQVGRRNVAPDRQHQLAHLRGARRRGDQRHVLVVLAHDLGVGDRAFLAAAVDVLAVAKLPAVVQRDDDLARVVLRKR